MEKTIDSPLPCHFCGKQPVFEISEWYTNVRCGFCQDKFGYVRFRNKKNAVKGWNLRQKKNANQLTIITHNSDVN